MECQTCGRIFKNLKKMGGGRVEILQNVEELKFEWEIPPAMPLMQTLVMSYNSHQLLQHLYYMLKSTAIYFSQKLLSV